SPSWSCFGSRARGASRRYAPHMQSGVSTSQQINQKKLNGRPRIRGSMRSQRDTEKQIAVKGISAKRIEPSDGLFKRPPRRCECGWTLQASERKKKKIYTEDAEDTEKSHKAGRLGRVAENEFCARGRSSSEG